MEEGTRRLERQREWRRRLERPDRIAMWAFVLALAMMLAAVASAHASSGGIGPAGTTSKSLARYSNLWTSFSTRDRRWAHRTSECESGGNPDAIGGGGKYHGAFQFTLPTWRHAPRSPGGDPVDYSWTTQAVVAVMLKHHVGTSPWPKCG